MKQSLGAKPLAAPTPVWCVGSYDEAGKPNVMTIAWGGICCSKPPCVTISLRQATYTYGCIMHRKAYTLSVPSMNHMAEADYFGLASGRNVDKFAATGLTAQASDLVDAPYVAEFPMVVECEVVHTYELGLHTQFVGEIKDVKVNEDCLTDAGHPDLAAMAPFVFGPGGRAYHGVTAQEGQGFADGKKFLKK